MADGLMKMLGTSEAWWANHKTMWVCNLIFSLGIYMLSTLRLMGRNIFCRAAAVCGFACERSHIIGENATTLIEVEFQIRLDPVSIGWNWIRCNILLAYLTLAMVASILIVCLNHPWLLFSTMVALAISSVLQDPDAENQNC
jgi:hypothetical protein